NQHDDVKKQLLDLQLQHNSLKLEHRKSLESHGQRLAQLQQEKDSEVANLQDTVFKLREESKLLRKAHQEVHSQLLNAQAQMEEFRQLKEALQKMPGLRGGGGGGGGGGGAGKGQQPLAPASSQLQPARQKIFQENRPAGNTPPSVLPMAPQLQGQGPYDSHDSHDDPRLQPEVPFTQPAPAQDANSLPEAVPAWPARHGDGHVVRFTRTMNSLPNSNPDVKMVMRIQVRSHEESQAPDPKEPSPAEKPPLLDTQHPAGIRQGQMQRLVAQNSFCSQHLGWKGQSGASLISLSLCLLWVCLKDGWRSSFFFWCVPCPLSLFLFPSSIPVPALSLSHPLSLIPSPVSIPVPIPIPCSCSCPLSPHSPLSLSLSLSFSLSLSPSFSPVPFPIPISVPVPIPLPDPLSPFPVPIPYPLSPSLSLLLSPSPVPIPVPILYPYPCPHPCPCHVPADAGVIAREEIPHSHKAAAVQEPMMPDDAADPAQDPNNQGEDEFEEAELERPDFEEKAAASEKLKEPRVKEESKEMPPKDAGRVAKPREDPLDDYQDDQEQEIEDHGGEVDDTDDLELAGERREHAGMRAGKKDDYF
ncbi:uncharacterized protein LOC130586765, partial [Malurus melanocephalus]|uniref:uncharacterized protein LOC130586765 n=1 Tax=Malurus melanocephalus TaxID=175006 RepID=UPI002549216D